MRRPKGKCGPATGRSFVDKEKAQESQIEVPERNQASDSWVVKERMNGRMIAKKSVCLSVIESLVCKQEGKSPASR